jgi:hypothetical protein
MFIGRNIFSERTFFLHAVAGKQKNKKNTDTVSRTGAQGNRLPLSSNSSVVFS